MAPPRCSIQHFSHPHPLELMNLQQQQRQPYSINLPPCAMCKLQPSELIYICKTCNFILHSACSERPQIINHPSDSNHPLTLLPFPEYPDGTFTCDACGLQDNGFCYHCRACTLDLHIDCASMPISLNHKADSHPLTLTYFRQHQFCTCDVCSGRITMNQWSYSCRACDFDAHVSCAANPDAQANYPNTGLRAAGRVETELSATANRINQMVKMDTLKRIQEMSIRASEGAKYLTGDEKWVWKHYR